MAGDAPPPELPPGLLADYLESMRGQLGVLAGLAERLVAASDDRDALDALRRETHKVHGSAGSYGFWDASRLAAGMEETVKDWVARPNDRDVERGPLTRWFVARLAEQFQLDVPELRPAELPAAASLRADSLQVPEVIVVEDDASLAELLQYGLRARGYHFASYRNGRQALDDLRALETGDAHPLLLLDVDLPALDGYSIFDALHRERPGTYRVVFTTVHGDEGEQLRGLETGALDYLVKPISLRVALKKVRRWVGR